MKIKPLEDWICGDRLEYKHRTLYVHNQETHRALVIAVGPGKRAKRWQEQEDPITGKRFRARVGPETDKIIPMEIKPGDVVEFSNYGWEDRVIDGKTYVFFRQGSVIGHANPDDTEGLQAHNSAII